MDTSASGGMAPALQSTNHQSTDLVNKEADVNGLQDILPLEKVNGSAHDSEKRTPIHNSGKPQSANLKIDSDYAAGDSAPKERQTEQSMTVTEAYLLTVQKAAQPPAASTTGLHIGQGDCPVTANASQNGWNNFKKFVLQENINTSFNVRHNGKELVTKSEKPVILSGCKNMNLEKIPDGANENCHNGEIKVEVDSSMNCSATSANQSNASQASLTNTSTVVTFSTATSPSAFQNTNIDFGNTRNIDHGSVSSFTTNSASGDPSLRNRVLLDGVITDCDKNGAALPAPVALPAAEVPDANNTSSPTPHLPHALKYADLLCGDLSKINVSHKLAHTLQELAASLKGTTLQQLDPSQVQNSQENDCNGTVTQHDQERLHRSVKSLDFTTCVTPVVKQPSGVSEDAKKCLQVKIDGAVSKAASLQNRLLYLNRRVDSLRVRSLKHYVQRNLRDVVSVDKWPCAVGDKTRNVGGEKWESEIIDITALHPNTVQHHKDDSNPSRKFWNKILEKRKRKAHSRYSPIADFTGKHQVPCQESAGTPENVKSVSTSQTNKDLSNDDRRSVSPEILGVNMDPIVQLTRVEHTESLRKTRSSLLDKAKVNNGILCKELKYIRSHQDPEITDSSSDEEVADNIKPVKHFAALPSKTTSRGKSLPRSDRCRKSFCKWVAERAEISRRWTWLQSRISNLEFSIRQQGDLYRTLRTTKGAVQLDVTARLPDARLTVVRTSKALVTPTPSSLLVGHTPCGAPTVPGPIASSTSPCNLNDLLNNVRHQTSRMFDDLSPLSRGSPSPQPILPKSPVTATVSRVENSNIHPARSSSRLEDKSMNCARTKPLRSSNFKQRKVIKLLPSNQRQEKPLRAKVVPNDSSIMCSEEKISQRRNLTPYESVALKAAAHDHSYHAVMSCFNDIPISVTMQAVMKSKRKWCENPGSSDKASSRNWEGKNAHYVKQSRKKSLKQKKKKSDRDASAMLPPSYSTDEHNMKRKRFGSQMSQQSDSSRRRHRGMSFDSDLELSLVIGGVSSQQSARSTPTHEVSGQHSYWKKKKSSEQAYDINNIVIPHGLNSARIEKLNYKEIQTPSWKIVDLKPEVNLSLEQETPPDVEDICHTAFQQRHDRYEILEKKKYMAYMEWSISRKGSRGSRMSNIGGPMTPEPTSPASPNYTPSPVPFTGEVARLSNPGNTSDQIQTMNDATSPTAKPAGVRTRRMSTDQNPARSTTPLSHHEADTSLSHSYSSPGLACWQDGLGYRRASCEKAAAVNRAMSEGSAAQRHEHIPGSWDVRSFPLQGEDVRLLEDIEYAIQRNRDSTQGQGPIGNGDSEGEDQKPRHFRPVSRQGSTDYDRASQSLPGNDQSGKPLSTEALQDHQRLQFSRSGSNKRRRTDSRASSLASYDDSGRYSDASNASASSYRRKRKKTASVRSRANSQQSREVVASRRQCKDSLLKLAQMKYKYLQRRLSETEDSSSDSDSDDSRTSDGTSTSFDDAGHMVDDFADPEWDFNTSKHRERR